MINLALSDDEKKITLTFPYSAGLLAVARGIPTRRWEPKTKAWVFPPTAENLRYIFSTSLGNSVTDTRILALYDERITSLTRAAERVAQARAGEIIITDFEFKTKPFEHQLRGFELTRRADQFALLCDMGTGKTKVIIDVAAWRFAHPTPLVKLVVVVCPKSVAVVWPKEIRVHCAVKSAIYSLVGLTPGGRLKVIENVVANIDQADHLRFLLVNYDLLDGLADELANLVKTVPTMLVLDESTAIKNPVAKRTAAACKIGSGAKYRIIMTGMPMTNTPLDVFSQFKFLHSGILGYDNYYAFRNRYCITGGFESHEIVAYVNLDELAEKVHKFSYRVKKSDCLDLPPKIFEARTIEMSPEQQGAYSRMAADFESEFIDGEIQITSHVITQIMRLRGITSGFQSKLVSETYVNGKTVRTFAPVPLGSNPKLNELESMVPELLSDPDTKVVVWCTFREEVRQIAGLFARLKIGFVEFHGGIEQHDREIAIDAFQTDPSVRVFLATVDSGGIGITLHAASTAIYFSKSYDLEHDAQSQDRLHRIGQKNNVTYISLVCAGTVDEAIEAALIGKRNMAAVITDKRSLIDFVRGRLSELMDAKR